jgi:hypothetical protein
MEFMSEGSRAHGCQRSHALRGAILFCAMALCLAVIGCNGTDRQLPPPLVQDADHDSVPDAQDCAPTDPTRWQLLAYQSVDNDADGHWVNSTGQVCAGASLPPGYSATAVAAGNADCNDASPAVWRFMMIYRDADGDGVGAGAGKVVCVGTSAPAGFSLFGYDPLDDPSDPTAASVSSLDLSSWQLTTP